MVLCVDWPGWLSRLADEIRGDEDVAAFENIGMAIMLKKLKDGDRTAVDMLLDQHASSQDGGLAASSAATPSFRQRLQAVEKTLSLLDSWQPADPPADLTLRTLRRIHDAESLRGGSARTNHTNAPQPRPVI